MSGESATARPDFRAICSEGELVLIPWRPELIGRYGPCNKLIGLAGGSGVAVADLTILRDPDGYELIVSELAPSSDGELLSVVGDWAASLGYRRIWCGVELVEFDAPLDAVGGVARTRCRSCRSEWSDESPEFWLRSRATGVFPLWCPLCGDVLPQWSVVPGIRDSAPAGQIQIGIMSPVPGSPEPLLAAHGTPELHLSSDETVSVTSQPEPRASTDTRLCVVCGSSLAGHRSDARHCSGACRAEAARLRAILRAAEGQRYRSIAERIEARRKRTQRA